MEKKSSENNDKKKPVKTVKAAVPDIDLSNPEFVTTLELLEKTAASVFLTGKAGTGKSTLLKYLASVTKKKFVILAPTGIAAVNAGGQTLHSFFKIPLKPLLPDDPDFSIHRIRQRLKYNSKHIKLLKSLQLIIIDEISMVRADIIDFIDKVLRVYCGNMKQPFGGKQMLFVGDVFQLEPVITGNDRDVLSVAYSSFYFFNARVFSQTKLVPVELTKVYRQNEYRFIELLDNIRKGCPTSEDVRLLNTRLNPSTESSEIDNGKNFTMTIATRRDMVDEINTHHLDRLKTPEVVFSGSIIDDFPSNALPTDLELRLKVGAQVVFIKNDPDRRWVNGTLAVVEVCLPDNLTVRTEDGVVHKLEPEAWNNVKYTFNEEKKTVEETVLGSFIQFPLKLAWALTIHKSQGLTFNKVIIDLGRGAFSGGQTYVALSRSRSLSGITLRSPISPRDIYVNQKITGFASRFNDERIIQGALSSGRADQLYKSASDAFDRGEIENAVKTFSEAICLRNELSNPKVVRLLSLRLNQINRLKNEVATLKSKLEDDRKRFEKIADEYCMLGDECRREGWDIEAALRNYRRAIEFCPTHFRAMMGLGNAYELNNDLTEAESNYFGAYISASDSQAWEPLVAIGDLHDREGDTYGAVSRYLEAYENNPTNLTVLGRLVEIYEKVEDFSSADEYRKLIVKLKSKKRKNSPS